MNMNTKINSYKKTIAVLDLDMTIIDCQSTELFVNYLKQKGIISQFFTVKVFIWVLLYKIGVINKVDEIYAKAVTFVRGMNVESLQSDASEVVSRIIKNHIRAGMVSEIDKLKNSYNELIILSNSPTILVSRIGEVLGITRCIGTELEIIGNTYSGKIKDKLMYGTNKVEAIRKIVEAENIDLSKSIAFSDHISDVPLLSMFGSAIVVHPNSKMKKVADQKNWPVIYF